jgi:hypothetical protein
VEYQLALAGEEAPQDVQLQRLDLRRHRARTAAVIALSEVFVAHMDEHFPACRTAYEDYCRDHAASRHVWINKLNVDISCGTVAGSLGPMMGADRASFIQSGKDSITPVNSRLVGSTRRTCPVYATSMMPRNSAMSTGI